MITKRIFWALLLLGLLASSTTSALAQSEAAASGAPNQQENQGGLLELRRQTIRLDVACDCRTFAYNRSAAFPAVVRGDGFIVNGKIFPAGALPTGEATNDPNDSGSIGDWICRGADTGAFAAGSATDPLAFVTQYHILSNGYLVSDGPTVSASETAVTAALIGGVGSFRGAKGEVSSEIIGTNKTGCPNIRFTIRLDKR
jgi:hypothetical protein